MLACRLRTVVMPIQLCCHRIQVDILFCYFGIRKFATHWVSLGFFCMLVPLSTFTPEVCALFASSCRLSARRPGGTMIRCERTVF
jgi:hypothetical protein